MSVFFGEDVEDLLLLFEDVEDVVLLVFKKGENTVLLGRVGWDWLLLLGQVGRNCLLLLGRVRREELDIVGILQQKKSYLLFGLENERLIISEKRDISNSRQFERFLILINWNSIINIGSFYRVLHRTFSWNLCQNSINIGCVWNKRFFSQRNKIFSIGSSSWSSFFVGKRWWMMILT